MFIKPTYEELEQSVEALEQKVAQQENLEKQLKLLSFAVDQSSEGIAMSDLDGNLKYLNSAFAKMHGYSPDELVGQKLSVFHTPEQMPFVETANAQLKQTGFFEGEIWHVRRDGTIFPAVMHNSLIRDDKETPIGMMATLRDISDIKSAEEALCESKDRLDSILKAAPIGIGLVIDRVLKHVNDHLCQMVGYSSAELLEQNARILYPTDEDFEYVGREKYAQIQKRGTGTVETHWQRKDGKIIDVLMSSTPLNIDDLSIGVTFTALDITERKAAERKLRKSEEKYRLLIKSLPCVVFRGYKDWTVELINENAELLTGYGVDEFNSRKKKWSDIILKEDIQAVRDHFVRALKTDHSYIREYRIRSKSGEIKWIQESGQIVCDPDGRIDYVSGVFFDITEIKNLRILLQQSQKMESIGTLAGGIAHDFNNILSAIIGYSEIVLADVKENKMLSNNLQQVLKASERAKDLVQQILTFSRQAEQELKPVQVKIIVKEALKLLRATLPTNIEIKFDINSRSAILADPTQIHQVLLNICTNSGYAMQEHGGVLDIKLNDVELGRDFTATHPDMEPGSYLNLTISDTGHGMSSKVLERIFEPFYTTKEKGEGTGMGLSVVHGIVKSHGGTITVQSMPKVGSTFNIFFPIVGRNSIFEAKAQEQIPTGTERILFIDDEEPIAKMVRQNLESLGYKVVIKTSSVEALELFQAQPDKFDLVITDMTMPHMTGDLLAKKLMAIRPDMPVILCTGFSARIDEKKAMAMGIRAFVSKPVSSREMAKVIREVLDG